MTILGYLIRLLLTLSIATVLIFYNYDFKIPLIALSSVYFLQYIILSPLLKDIPLRYFIYLVDFGFVGYTVYTTDQIYLSLFLFLLLADITRKVDFYILSTLAFGITSIFFYRLGFYEFIVVYLSIGILFVLFVFLKEIDRRDRDYKSLSEITKSIYTDNLVCSDKMEFFRRYYEITQSIKKLKKGEINLEDCGDTLYRNLNCDGLFILNREDGSIVCKGKQSCEPEALDLASNLDIEELKKRLSVRFIVIREVEDYIILILYKDYVLIDKDILEAMS